VQVDAPDGIGYTSAVKPYLLDLESMNKTHLNGEALAPARYYELLSGDVVRFGLSSREWVIMNEASAG
jgi:smad nuclear-interacting protein 1